MSETKYLISKINKSESKDFGDSYEFVITSEAIDRSGDRVLMSGLDISNYLLNPVVFFNHDTSAVPIATTKTIEQRNINGLKSLVASIEFNTFHPDYSLIKGSIDGGFLNSASIGFRAFEMERTKLTEAEQMQFNRKEIVTFTKSELLEFSIVTIPANQTANRIKSFEEMDTLIKAGRVLSASNESKLVQATTLLNEVVASATKEENKDVPNVNNNEAKAEAEAYLQTNKGENDLENEIVKDTPIVETKASAETTATNELELVQKKLVEMETKFHDLARSKSAIEVPTQTPEDEVNTKLLAISGLIHSKGNIEVAKSQFASNIHVSKQLDTLSSTTGGLLVVDEQAPTILPFYYAKSILSRLGVRRVPMATNEIRMPISGAFSSLGYTAKYTPGAEADITLSEINLKSSDIKATLVIGSDLIKNSAYNILNWVRAEITNYAPSWIDSEFLYGTGAANGMIGIYSQILADNLVSQTGTTLTAIKTDTLNAISKIEATDLPLNEGSTAWVMHPANLRYLQALSTTTGASDQWLLTLQGPNPMLHGYPVYTSTTVGKTKILFGDWSYVYFGVQQELALDFEFEGNYKIGSTTYIGKDENKSPLRVSAKYGNKLAYPSGLSAITSLTWVA